MSEPHTTPGTPWGHGRDLPVNPEGDAAFWRARAERAEAQCAALREALEDARSMLIRLTTAVDPIPQMEYAALVLMRTHAALSTDAGSALLDDRNKLLAACNEVTDALGFERDAVWPTDAPSLVRDVLKELKALREVARFLVELRRNAAGRGVTISPDMLSEIVGQIPSAAVERLEKEGER